MQLVKGCAAEVSSWTGAFQMKPIYCRCQLGEDEIKTIHILDVNISCPMFLI